MNSFFRPDQIPIYMNSMRPVLNKKALFTDMTSTYVDPPEPNPYSLVTIRFRAGKNNIDRVYIVIRNT